MSCWRLSSVTICRNSPLYFLILQTFIIEWTFICFDRSSSMFWRFVWLFIWKDLHHLWSKILLDWSFLFFLCFKYIQSSVLYSDMRFPNVRFFISSFLLSLKWISCMLFLIMIADVSSYMIWNDCLSCIIYIFQYCK